MPVLEDWLQKRNERVKLLKQLGSSDRTFYLSDDPLKDFTYTESVKSWSEFLQWLSELQGSWCFRGQREASWLLSTSLDRAVRVELANGYYHRERESTQRDLLFRFQQQAHNHVVNVPDIDDTISWLALMQHYGAPTRLLDWSKSAFVALHFALVEEPQEEAACSAVWAINLKWLEEQEREFAQSGSLTSPYSRDDFNAKAKCVNDYIRDSNNNKPIIICIDPLKISERMVAQQGTFLCKMVHQIYFGGVLVHMMTINDTPVQPVVRKITINKSLRIAFLKRLRDMNIHIASLYPGLDGLGKSLKLDQEIKAKNDLSSDAPEGCV